MERKKIYKLIVLFVSGYLIFSILSAIVILAFKNYNLFLSILFFIVSGAVIICSFKILKQENQEENKQISMELNA